jgi:uncharacterized protein
MKYAAVFRYENKGKIPEVRPKHREYLAQLKEAGKLWASGPFTDDSGSLIIYEAESEEEAESLIQNDPFHEAGIFASYSFKPWERVF